MVGLSFYAIITYFSSPNERKIELLRVHVSSIRGIPRKGPIVKYSPNYVIPNCVLSAWNCCIWSQTSIDQITASSKCRNFPKRIVASEQWRRIVEILQPKSADRTNKVPICMHRANFRRAEENAAAERHWRKFICTGTRQKEMMSGKNNFRPGTSSEAVGKQFDGGKLR